MTRVRLNRTLRRVYTLLFALFCLALATKLFENVRLWPGTNLGDIYEVLRDMALVIITVFAAYLANVFQKRATFVRSLEREWRRIVRTKAALFAYCEAGKSDLDAYIEAYCEISQTLDNMRIVYRNVGETTDLIGLYPYEPLHDMRRALESIDPRSGQPVSNGEFVAAREAVLQAFAVLRETFLEELDLQEPAHPLLVTHARRLKRSGATRRASRMLAGQTRKQQNGPATNGPRTA